MMFSARYLRVQNEWSLTSSDSSAATFSIDRTDGGDAQPRQRPVIGLGHEVGRHQGEAIVLALVVELAVALPRRPDRPHGLHVFADARRRRRPWHGEAPLVVGADL